MHPDQAGLNNLAFFTFLIVLSTIYCTDETWQKDLTPEIEIGLSTSGYGSVDLKCGFNEFVVNVKVNHDFSGIVYTRGDFQSKRKPCFYKKIDATDVGDDILLFKMNIPFTDCHTVEDVSDQQYINTVVVQHDDELIMPGDAAFQLNCAFEPEVKLSSSIKSGPWSRITLVDADPASNKTSKEHRAESDSNTVSFSVGDRKKEKDEL